MNTTPTNAIELDEALRAHIQTYVETYGEKQLSYAIKEFVINNFKELIESSDKTELPNVRKAIAHNTPSIDLITKYIEGDSICDRYINTLARFFELKYNLTDYNAAVLFTQRQQRTSTKN